MKKDTYDYHSGSILMMGSGMAFSITENKSCKESDLN